jgi:hypothetical protein
VPEVTSRLVTALTGTRGAPDLLQNPMTSASGIYDGERPVVGQYFPSLSRLFPGDLEARPDGGRRSGLGKYLI